ncbi:hypothetical protein PCIT_a1278 [Pseudoalteromonas citrea]|uniref:Outer membrane protein beta-barrel domain-containing protein n=2 Tax=Pseudoalteromonas citrea TaxID=43655 RepID=A0AAD4FTL9_9GAMM|nr:outer membrane beta-barrel protein [Pseudoalteromonas citrea]KAF7775155.1 hypothetical protein PCIT_a1278 [Pseudoalteromonas citrea]
MKYSILGVAALLLPLSSYAQMQFSSELLLGKSQNDIHSSIELNNKKKHYSSDLVTNSLGVRVGVKFSDYISFELSKHFHGDGKNEVTMNVYAPLDYPSFQVSGEKIEPISSYKLPVPIELESTRLGIKAQTRLFDTLSVNMRLGIAQWGYQASTPARLTFSRAGYDMQKSGNDVFYSVGLEHQITENWYVGFEYSLMRINESDVYVEIDSISRSYQHDVKEASFILGWQF